MSNEKNAQPDRSPTSPNSPVGDYTTQFCEGFTISSPWTNHRYGYGIEFCWLTWHWYSCRLRIRRALVWTYLVRHRMQQRLCMPCQSQGFASLQYNVTILLRCLARLLRWRWLSKKSSAGLCAVHIHITAFVRKFGMCTINPLSWFRKSCYVHWGQACSQNALNAQFHWLNGAQKPACNAWTSGNELEDNNGRNGHTRRTAFQSLFWKVLGSISDHLSADTSHVIPLDLTCQRNFSMAQFRAFKAELCRTWAGDSWLHFGFIFS